ncbi:hypothetical protein N7494_003573 [Penicillium frequentans]|uniref:Uncharacterized protein n=1 Tax=Penicillium frequentans TaxID=3151616 RepID=A0AAD6CYW9_9EURO|nr:hypothetical protein N7494_003573 [Penicillium glabrum]
MGEAIPKQGEDNNKYMMVVDMSKLDRCHEKVQREGRKMGKGEAGKNIEDKEVEDSDDAMKIAAKDRTQ